MGGLERTWMTGRLTKKFVSALDCMERTEPMVIVTHFLENTIILYREMCGISKIMER